MRIILVRHGETASNRERLALGRNDVALNELGRQQAARVAGSLARDAARGLAIEAIYTSPLLRTRQTAEAIEAALGCPTLEAPDLIEMDVGATDGLTGSELRERYPSFLREWWSEGAAESKMPGGGESLADVQARAWTVVERLQAEHPPEAAVVAVTHNFVIRTLVCRILGVDLAGFRRFEQDLASITRIEFRGNRSVVTALNETCHLAGLDTEPPYRHPR